MPGKTSFNLIIRHFCLTNTFFFLRTNFPSVYFCTEACCIIQDDDFKRLFFSGTLHTKRCWLCWDKSTCMVRGLCRFATRSRASSEPIKCHPPTSNPSVAFTGTLARDWGITVHQRCHPSRPGLARTWALPARHWSARSPLNCWRLWDAFRSGRTCWQRSQVTVLSRQSQSCSGRSPRQAPQHLHAQQHWWNSFPSFSLRLLYFSRLLVILFITFVHAYWSNR